MTVCLQCGSRLAVDPDVEKLAGEVASAARTDRKSGVDNDIQHIAKAIREFADEAQHGRSVALSIATKLAVAAGIRCGIAQNPLRGREVGADHKRKLLYDRGFDRRFAVFIDLPSPVGDGVNQVSWHIHESELGLFGHLEPISGWHGESTAATADDAIATFLRTR